MAFFRTHFFADALGVCTRANVLLPDRPDPAVPLPALYLLHGLSDDETIWMRRTSLELFASDRNLAIVMPDGGRSFYSNLRSGQRFFDYVAEELPSLMERWFRLDPRREGRFVAGLSMGGYGALKAALSRPDRYAAAAGLSSVCDVRWVRDGNKAIWDSMLPPGTAEPPPDLDLFALAERVAARPAAERPALFQYCGTDDFLWQDNLRFRDRLRELGLAPRWEEGPGGHCWENWNERIQHVLDWLPLAGTAGRTGAIGV